MATFHVLDATRYTSKPEPSTWGARKATAVYGNAAALVWDPETHDGSIVWMNVEHLDLDIRTTPDHVVQSNMDTIADAIDRLHEKFPGMKVGFYGACPLRDFWTPVQYANNPSDPVRRSNYRAWKRANARFRYSVRDGVYSPIGLADKVDVVYPSIYAFYENASQWQVYARANISEAQAYGKVVYPFVWPAYHHNANPGELAGTYVGNSYWETMLQTCLESSATGLVIWGNAGEDVVPPNSTPLWTEASSTWLPTTTDWIETHTPEPPIE